MRFSAALLVLLTISAIAPGCYNSVIYNPYYAYPNDPYSPCGYDTYYGYYCYSEGSVHLSKDLTTDLAQEEQIKLGVSARHFAGRFQLTQEQGMKIAKSVHDYNTLQTRSDQDAADFARRLYGIEPTRILNAVAQAQMGNSSALDAVVADAALNFDTTQPKMREIVKALHAQLIRDQGLSF